MKQDSPQHLPYTNEICPACRGVPLRRGLQLCELCDPVTYQAALAELKEAIADE